MSFATVRFSFCPLSLSKIFQSSAINETKQNNKTHPVVYLEPFWRKARRFRENL